MRVRSRFITIALTVALAACATPPEGTSGARSDRPPADLPFATCGDRSTLEADPASYRDEPHYDQPLELLDDAVAWASTQPGFEQPWLDHEHEGWIHLGFSGDVDVAALQDAVEREFPGEGVVVVHLPHSQATLTALADRVSEALRAAGTPSWGTSADAAYGLVSVDALPPEPATLEALTAFAGEPLCVDLLPADSLVAQGEQPVEGRGWRLLGHERGVGDVYRTGVATNDEQLDALWAQSGLPGEPDPVDWQSEIVVWFGAVYGSSCPVRLDGVVVTGSALHGDIVVPGWPGACRSDANPHSFVVAVGRSLLPQAPFHVQLNAEDPPPGAPEERTTIEVDLRSPGAET
ncbi:MAG: hypothetical protein M3Y20_04190 [Actinomycetota bacterium]|nr:hypothetical protein [Actinomycetota bacterium]